MSDDPDQLERNLRRLDRFVIFDAILLGLLVVAVVLFVVFVR